MYLYIILKLPHFIDGLAYTGIFKITTNNLANDHINSVSPSGHFFFSLVTHRLRIYCHEPVAPQTSRSPGHNAGSMECYKCHKFGHMYWESHARLKYNICQYSWCHDRTVGMNRIVIGTMAWATPRSTLREIIIANHFKGVPEGIFVCSNFPISVFFHPPFSLAWNLLNFKLFQRRVTVVILHTTVL